jgi:NAD(P)H dehydrogenase (quinone)
MRNFFDTMGGLWVSGALADKPAGVFTSTATMHGGQELTLLNMWPQLAHLGMVIVGLGYLDERVASTQSGGTPYGPSHIAGATSDRPLDDDEAALCRFLGRRVARLAGKLAD